MQEVSSHPKFIMLSLSCRKGKGAMSALLTLNGTPPAPPTLLHTEEETEVDTSDLADILQKFIRVAGGAQA